MGKQARPNTIMSTSDHAGAAELKPAAPTMSSTIPATMNVGIDQPMILPPLPGTYHLRSQISFVIRLWKFTNRRAFSLRSAAMRPERA